MVPFFLDDIRPNWHLLMARGPEKSLSGVGSTRRQLVRPNEEATARSRHIRAWDSPYYERQTGTQDWTADENTAVMDAIRESSGNSTNTTSSPLHHSSCSTLSHHQPISTF